MTGTVGLSLSQREGAAGASACKGLVRTSPASSPDEPPPSAVSRNGPLRYRDNERMAEAMKLGGTTEYSASSYEIRMRLFCFLEVMFHERSASTD